MRARMTAMTLALLTLVGGPAAARPVTIADVIGSPESYSGKTVTVSSPFRIWSTSPRSAASLGGTST